MSTSIHSTAIVSSKAELGADVTIGPFAIVHDDVIIHDNTTIGPRVLIDNGARIGKGCTIHQGVVVATPPQDLKYKDERTFFEIGDNTTIREYCTLNRGTTEHWKSTVGNNCLLMAYVHIAHDCAIGNNVILANSVQMGGHTTIEDWVIVGGLTAIHQFVTIGQHSMVGGHFRVPKDVPPYIMAGNLPLSFERLNIVGLRRRGFSQTTIDALNEAYRILYLSKLNVSQAVERIKKELVLTPEVQNLLTFIAKSKRGIITARSHE